MREVEANAKLADSAEQRGRVARWDKVSTLVQQTGHLCSSAAIAVTGQRRYASQNIWLSKQRIVSRHGGR